MNKIRVKKPSGNSMACISSTIHKRVSEKEIQSERETHKKDICICE